jgi:hypothetical protein
MLYLTLYQYAYRGAWDALLFIVIYVFYIQLNSGDGDDEMKMLILFVM